MNPIKEYLYIGLTAFLLVAVLWFTHHERMEGEQKVIAAQHAADLKYEAETAKREANVKVQTDALQKQLDTALLTPVHPGIVVRMLVPTTSASGTVRKDASPGKGSDDAAGPNQGLGDSDHSVDIATVTEAILARDKAVIAYLQGYISKCQSAGICQQE